MVGTVIRMRVPVPSECPALGCKGQSLCAGLVDGSLVVGGLVVAVAAARFIIVWQIRWDDGEEGVGEGAYRWWPF